jgi:muconate cycloisomerase
MADRIDALTVTLIATPIAMKRAQGSGAIERAVKRVIVQLRTAAGIDGLGEAQAWEPFGGTAEGTAAALDRYLRPVVLGADPSGITGTMAACDAALAGHPEAKAAIETALFDILGRRLGVPVHALLGGAVRDAIPLSFSIADPDFEADLDRAQAMVATGHRIFKMKTGFLSPAEDFSRLERLQAAVPEAEVRIDYNQGLSPIEAPAVLRRMASLKPGFIEQPIPRGYEPRLAELSAMLDVPVLADESIFDAADMLRCAHERWADAASIKLMKAGGILKARRIAAIAEAAGIPTYGGTLWEGGIALSAAAHLIAATLNISLGCEFYMPRYAMLADIASPGLAIEAGQVIVPTAPGLGQALDATEFKRQTEHSR